MYVVWNRTDTTIGSGTFVMGPHETRLFPILPVELNDAVTQGLVEVSSFDATTRQYNFTPANCFALDVTDTPQKTPALTSREILVCATKDMFITIQADPDTATGIGAVAGCIPLLGGEKMHLQIVPGQKLGYVQMSENGKLFIVPTITG
jgi:hypothetical protein